MRPSAAGGTPCGGRQGRLRRLLRREPPAPPDCLLGGASGAGRPLRGDGSEPPRLEGQERGQGQNAEATIEAEESAAEAPTRAGAGGSAGHRLVQLRGGSSDGLPSLWASVPGLLLRGRVAGYGGTTAGGPPGGGAGTRVETARAQHGKGGCRGGSPWVCTAVEVEDLDQAHLASWRPTSALPSALAVAN